MSVTKEQNAMSTTCSLLKSTSKLQYFTVNAAFSFIHPIEFVIEINVALRLALTKTSQNEWWNKFENVRAYVRPEKMQLQV